MKASRTLSLLVAAALLPTACGGEEVRSAPCSERPRGTTAELVYEVEGDATPRSMATRVCQRLVKLTTDPALVRPVSERRIQIVTSNAGIAWAAVDGPSVYFYEWEPRVLGPRGPDSPYVGSRAFFDAVELASSSPSFSGEGLPERFYLFGADRRLVAGPVARRDQLPAAPAGGRVMRVPEGVAVIEDARQDGPRGRYFVIEDKPELTIANLERSSIGTDPVTGEPVVIFDFLPSGRRAFRRLTARLASRGNQPYGRFAIVINGQVLSLPTIDPVANPDGIDAPNAQVVLTGAAKPTRRLAQTLAAPSLTAELRLISIR